MMTLQQEAAENIFQERNQTSYQSNEYTIDLHGLHPEEAIHFMEREVQDLKRKKWSGSVFIITGTGNHSRGGKAKVLPEIRQYLQSSRLKYREGTMSDGRGGVFYVTL
jgi:DNA-nicking Smr family endonuclease